MALKVVGAGLGRTGTHSLKIALEQLLGAPCYHMIEVFQHPEHIPAWHAAAKGEPVDWESLFSGYSAAVDWPAGSYWREISAAYPEALIVLSTRDSEKWWQSTQNTIFKSMSEYDHSDPKWIEMVNAMMANRFTTNLKDRESCVGAFERHNQDVIENAPKDRLLVWTASDGWEPLCSALGVPVPENPFPLTNTTEQFVARRAEMLAGKSAN